MQMVHQGENETQITHACLFLPMDATVERLACRVSLYAFVLFL